jgi:uncharacterized protein (TIGR02996 family)
VTEEDMFQITLDESWVDHNTRLALADWLRDHDDPRADGYQFLAEGKNPPWYDGIDYSWWNWSRIGDRDTRPYPDDLTGMTGELPEDLFNLVAGKMGNEGQKKFRTRQMAEDALAEAFQKLPGARRDELLGRVSRAA